MRRLRFRRAAQRDLVSILDYITRRSASLTVGRRFVQQLRKHCAKLASLPGTLGRARPELHPDVRSSVYKGYVIFFRYRNGTLEIINILEGHRDIDDHSNIGPAGVPD